MYELAVGDYISFTRIVRPKQVGMKFQLDFDSQPGVTLSRQVNNTEARIVAAPGEGRIKSISRSEKKIDGERVRTGRIDLGKFEGIVTAILNDAVLVGKQMTFDTGEVAQVATQTMYGTDGSHA